MIVSSILCCTRTAFVVFNCLLKTSSIVLLIKETNWRDLTFQIYPLQIKSPKSDEESNGKRRDKNPSRETCKVMDNQGFRDWRVWQG